MQAAALNITRTIIIGSILGLSACSSLPFVGKEEKQTGTLNTASYDTKTTALGVNGYLWRAALDTVSELPVASTDSTGGVISTDWFTSDTAPNERLMMNIYIMDDQLRADALRVMVHRQIMTDGSWTPADVKASTNQQLEDTILLRARELRIRAID